MPASSGAHQSTQSAASSPSQITQDVTTRQSGRKKLLVFTERTLALSETFIAAHCRSLQDYDFTLVALENSGSHHDVPRTLLHGNHAGRLEQFVFRFGKSGAMDRLIAEIKPDIVHAHYLMGGAFMAPYAARHRVPLVTTVHGHDATRRFRPFSPYDRLFARETAVPFVS
jgi:hypothetical protein